MRFRKSICVCKGVKINLSKSGPSLTVGQKGLSFNVGQKGMFVNWSIPKTGIYDRVRVDTLLKDKLGGFFGNNEEADGKPEKRERNAKSVFGVNEEEQLEVMQEQGFVEIASLAPDVSPRTGRAPMDAQEAEAALEEWLGEAEAPVEFALDIKAVPEKRALMIDLDLPEIENLPSRKLMMLKSGEVKIKDKTQKEQKRDYRKCVFGLGMYVAANALALVEQAERVLVSAYTQRRDAGTGDRMDVFIYSLVFERSSFVSGYQNEEPEEFCRNLRGRFYVLSSGVMKEIVPLEAEDI